MAGFSPTLVYDPIKNILTALNRLKMALKAILTYPNK